MTKPNPAPQKHANPLTDVMSQPYLLLTMSALFWGGNVIAGKLAVGEIDPFGLSTLRWIGALLILAPFAWKPLRADWPEIRRGMGWLAFYGAFGFTTFNALMYGAAPHTTAINMAMIQAAIPVLVMVGNFVVFKVRASMLHIVGVALTIYGVIHIATQGAPTRLIGLELNFGDALVLASCVTYAIHSLLLRYMPKISWMSFIAVTSFFATVAAIVYQILFSSGMDGLVREALDMSPTGWMVVAYVAVLPSVVAQMTYAAGVGLIGPNRASLFINLIPLIGAILAVAMLGERLEMFHFIAAAFIVIGIAAANYAGRKVAGGVKPPSPGPK